MVLKLSQVPCSPSSQRPVHQKEVHSVCAVGQLLQIQFQPEVITGAVHHDASHDQSSSAMTKYVLGIRLSAEQKNSRKGEYTGKVMWIGASLQEIHRGRRQQDEQNHSVCMRDDGPLRTAYCGCTSNTNGRRPPFRYGYVFLKCDRS
jgi:hypothetical protein